MPPNNITATMTGIGVVGDSAAQATKPSATRPPLTSNVDAKAEPAQHRARGRLDAEVAAEQRQHHEARLDHAEAERQLEHQRQQERRAADGDAERRAADHRDAEGRHRSGDRSTSGCAARAQCDQRIAERDAADQRAARHHVPGNGRMAGQVEPVHQGGEAEPAGDEAEPVERPRCSSAPAGDPAQREEDRDRAERHVEEEDPAPAPGTRDAAAERRPEHRRGQPRPGDGGDGARPGPLFGVVRSTTSRPTGTIMRAADALHDPRRRTKPAGRCEGRRAIEASVKTQRSRRRRPGAAPNRSATQPLTGMKTASASR